MCRWLELCGYLHLSKGNWIYKDQGEVISEWTKTERNRRKGNVFTAPASPSLTLEVLNWIIDKNSIGKKEEKSKGYRNALSILSRFEIIRSEEDRYIVEQDKVSKFPDRKGLLWLSANAEEVLLDVVKLMEANENISGKEIGEYVANEYDLAWTDASQMRNGGAIKQWAYWLYQSKFISGIPEIPSK